MTATVSLISNTDVSVSPNIVNPNIPLAAVVSYAAAADGVHLVFEFAGGNSIAWRFANNTKLLAAKGHIDALVTAAQAIANT
jgi:hypothetical protein